MPRHDDPSVSEQAVLIRAIRPDWVIVEQDGERLSSATFADGQLEASCFIAEEVGGLAGFCENVLPELTRLLGVPLRVATVTAESARSEGLWVYRKPEEYKDNPAHVVICPPEGVTKNQYKARTRRLTDHATLIPIA